LTALKYLYVVAGDTGFMLTSPCRFLQNNLLNASIPDTIWQLTELKELYVRADYSDSFGTQFRNRKANDNQFTGSVTSTIGQLGKLKYLYVVRAYSDSVLTICRSIYNTRLTGTITSAIGQLTSLTALYVFQGSRSLSLIVTIGVYTTTVSLERFLRRLDN
jgi:hypothetical protein